MGEEIIESQVIVQRPHAAIINTIAEALDHLHPENWAWVKMNISFIRLSSIGDNEAGRWEFHGKISLFGKKIEKIEANGKWKQTNRHINKTNINEMLIKSGKQTFRFIRNREGRLVIGVN
ncbi:MAG TPA: hypothetical protein ENL27_01755 [Candidatus Parcubacteria bacterium]|nr:hypothetical protein [Candidatus Parcubacteria bacterium]